MEEHNIKKMLIIMILYVLYINLYKGYVSYIPTIPIYPNNQKEIIKLKQLISFRTQEDINFFYLTNKTVSSAFLPYVNDNMYELDQIATSQNNLILFCKYVINRPRPNQIDPSIQPINIDTAQTPAYPAGHSFQAYLLYKHLSKKYPNQTKLFEEIALRCDDCRVKAGLHYPSDGIFSRQIVDNIFR